MEPLKNTSALGIHTQGYRVSDVQIATADADPRCVIGRPQCAKMLDRRTMFRQLPYGFTPDRAPIHVDSNDIDTQVAGLQHRVCRLTPLGAKEIQNKLNLQKLRDFEEFVRSWIATHLKPLNEEPDFEDWLQNTSYNDARKQEIRHCYQDLKGSAPTQKQRRKIASFIKTESYPDFKHARWINSRSDHFKAYSGPWFKSVEKEVFDLHWFIKHVPVPLRGAKVASIMRDGAKYYATDYTSFEAHFHPLFMKACEGQLYSYMLQKFPKVSKVITETIFGTNHGRTRRGVSFILKGRRMSGDMCTSLGNGFSNLMIWSYLCSKRGAQWDGFVEGDDGIFAVYSGDAPEKSEYAELGFTVKIEPGEDPRTMSFCGIIAADGQNIRSPDDFLCNFGWSSSFLTAGPRIQAQLLRAKALSAAWETPHCPIIRAIADRALVLTQGSIPRFVDDGYHKKPEDKIPCFSPTALTRAMFSDLYGISPTMQVLCEERIRNGEDLKFLDRVIPPHPSTIAFANFFVLRQ